MYDLHAIYDSTGNDSALTLINSTGIIASGDGAAVAGVPIAPGATLKHWGFLTTIADTLNQIKLISQDQIDSINGELWNPGSNSTVGLMNVEEALPFVKAARLLYYEQNTAAAKIAAYTIDQYTAPMGASRQNLGQHVIIPQPKTGALTAGAWGTMSFAPSAVPPAGTYAILGAYVTALTNYALLRFEHADFKGFKPGFPVVDASLAASRAVMPPNDSLFNLYGRQFVAMGDIPTFRITAQSTGLQIDMLSLTADTPNVIVNLAQVVPTSKS